MCKDSCLQFERAPAIIRIALQHNKEPYFVKVLYKFSKNSKAENYNNVNNFYINHTNHTNNQKNIITNCKAVIINAIYNLNLEVNNNLKRFYNWGVVMFFEKKTCKKNNLAYYVILQKTNKRGKKISYAK